MCNCKDCSSGFVPDRVETGVNTDDSVSLLGGFQSYDEMKEVLPFLTDRANTLQSEGDKLRELLLKANVRDRLRTAPRGRCRIGQIDGGNWKTASRARDPSS